MGRKIDLDGCKSAYLHHNEEEDVFELVRIPDDKILDNFDSIDEAQRFVANGFKDPKKFKIRISRVEYTNNKRIIYKDEWERFEILAEKKKEFIQKHEKEGATVDVSDGVITIDYFRPAMLNDIMNKSLSSGYSNFIKGMRKRGGRIHEFERWVVTEPDTGHYDRDFAINAIERLFLDLHMINYEIVGNEKVIGTGEKELFHFSSWDNVERDFDSLINDYFNKENVR